jgi:hypothetical protein
MDEAQARAERSGLKDLLDKYQSGEARHLESGDHGALSNDTTDQRVTDLKKRISELDRQIASFGPAA